MPSKIEWCDETINPLGWGCYGPGGTAENPKPCSYCYARRMAARGLRKCGLCNQFIPHMHLEQLLLLNKWKKPKKIFIESMGDLFHDAIPDEWIEEVFKACEEAPQHTYLFLTKNYLKASKYKYRDNWWIGKTITNNDNSRLFEGDPWSVDRIDRANQFLSIEPIQGDISDLKYYLYSFRWVIIGAETGQNKNKIIPKREWIEDIVNQCKTAGVPVFLKNSLKALMGDNFIQEWPEEMDTFNK